MTTTNARAADAVVDARAKDRNGHLMIKGYCDHPDCSAREVNIHVKDYDRTLLQHLESHGGLLCPLCGALLKVHQALTMAEWQEQSEREARMSVNTQIYLRDHGGSFIPAPEMCNDALPQSSAKEKP